MAKAGVQPRKEASQDRSRAMVEALLDATARVLIAEGYDRASTNRIAAVAGVSVGSLYQYFPNKESLVAALVMRHNRQMLGGLRDSLTSLASSPLEPAVRELVRAAIEAHRVDPVLHRIFSEQVPRIGVLAEVDAVQRDVADLVRTYLEQRRDEIEVADLDLAAFIIVTTVETLTHQIVLGGRDPAGEQTGRFVEEITRLIVRYLRPAG